MNSKVSKIIQLLLLCKLVFIIGCSTPKVENVVSQDISFELLDYFQGQTTAWGIVVDRFGNFQKTFKVYMTGIVNNNELELKEYFTYNNGDKEYREWLITKTGPDSYEGRSDNSLGVATGKKVYNTLDLTYYSEITVGELKISVKFDDRFVKTNDNVLINRAEITKWGVKVADVTIFFQK